MASTGDSRTSALRLRNRQFLRLVIPTRRPEEADSGSGIGLGSGLGSGSDRQPKEALLNSVVVSSTVGTLTPDIHAGRTRSDLHQNQNQSQHQNQNQSLGHSHGHGHGHMQHVECVSGEFLVYHDPATQSSAANSCALRAFDLQRRCMCVCKTFPMSQQNSLNVYTAALRTEHLVVPKRVKVHNGKLYAFFDVNYGDLHFYIRQRQRLRECEARRLFRQIACALSEAHRYGVVLRDLKLRKLVFADAQRTTLLLDGITDGVLLDEPLEDQLAGPHQCCPAYLSPEVLDNARTGLTYSGRASDCWSLGVILFTMITGRYPFWSAEPVALFERITAAQYCIPEHCSAAVRSLIASLLRKEQSERLTVEQVLQHPWLSSTTCVDHANQPCMAPSPVCTACATSACAHGMRHDHESRNRDYASPSANAQANANANASTNANANANTSTSNTSAAASSYATQWLLAPVVSSPADIVQFQSTSSDPSRVAQASASVAHALGLSMSINSVPSNSNLAAGSERVHRLVRAAIGTATGTATGAATSNPADESEAVAVAVAASTQAQAQSQASVESSVLDAAAHNAAALNRVRVRQLELDAENMRERAINAAESDALSESNNHYRASAASNIDASANANASASASASSSTSANAHAYASANGSVLFYGIAPAVRANANAMLQMSASTTSASSLLSLSFGDAYNRSDRHRNRHRVRADRGPYSAEHARRAKLHCARVSTNDQSVPTVPY